LKKEIGIIDPHHPFKINPFSFEVQNIPSLYAIGSITGNNFVRFGVGGALGVVSSLLSKKNMNR